MSKYSGLYERTDDEVVKLMHKNEHDSIFEAFSRLVHLHGGDEVKAAHALREENLFVRNNPPLGGDYGSWMRNWLIINGLEWNQENLKAALFHYKECHQ